MDLFEREINQAKNSLALPARAILEELENMLSTVYADVNVSREKVKKVVARGRNLTEKEGAWLDGPEKSDEFLKLLDKFENKIHRTLDLKKMKEEGLVKTVKF